MCIEDGLFQCVLDPECLGSDYVDGNVESETTVATKKHLVACFVKQQAKPMYTKHRVAQILPPCSPANNSVIAPSAKNLPQVRRGL